MTAIVILRWLIGPIGRWVVLAVVGLIAVWFVVHSIQESAIQGAANQAVQDANKRLQDAVRNGDAVDTSPDKLRQPNPHCRDC